MKERRRYMRRKERGRVEERRITIERDKEWEREGER